jgi:hydrogenase maturation factor
MDTKKIIEERDTFGEVFQYGGGSFFYLMGASLDTMRECFEKASKDGLFSKTDWHDNEIGWYFMLHYGYSLTLVDREDEEEYKITLESFRKAVKWANKQYGEGWRDNADSETYDCIIQVMAFGEVIYG